MQGGLDAAAAMTGQGYAGSEAAACTATDSPERARKRQLLRMLTPEWIRQWSLGGAEWASLLPSAGSGQPAARPAAGVPIPGYGGIQPAAASADEEQPALVAAGRAESLAAVRSGRKRTLNRERSGVEPPAL